MQNIIKDILISQLSFPLKYKNEKEIWWENEWGHPITIEIIDIENKQYVKRGYYDDGQLGHKINYSQGQKHGELLWWYDNGKLNNKLNYHQGRKHGECLWWYRDGQLLRKENYHQGERHGECSGWHENGEPEYKRKYNHGKLINAKYY